MIFLTNTSTVQTNMPLFGGPLKTALKTSIHKSYYLIITVTDSQVNITHLIKYSFEINENKFQ